MLKKIYSSHTHSSEANMLKQGWLTLLKNEANFQFWQSNHEILAKMMF